MIRNPRKRGPGTESNGPRRRKHMKLKSLSQLFLASAMGLVVAAFLSACQLVTIDYVYLAGAGSAGGNGGIQAFAVDSQSGALREGGVKSVDSGGPTPVAIAVSATYTDLY